MKVPPGAEWHITCELKAKDGTVVARPVPLLWSASWARDANTNTLGATFKGFLESTLQSTFAPAARRRR